MVDSSSVYVAVIVDIITVWPSSVKMDDITESRGGKKWWSGQDPPTSACSSTKHHRIIIHAVGHKVLPTGLFVT